MADTRSQRSSRQLLHKDISFRLGAGKTLHGSQSRCTSIDDVGPDVRFRCAFGPFTLETKKELDAFNARIWSTNVAAIIAIPQDEPMDEIVELTTVPLNRPISIVLIYCMLAWDGIVD